MMKNKTLSDRYPKGQLVRSRQGRDQNKLYIVTASDDQISLCGKRYKVDGIESQKKKSAAYAKD